MLCPQCGYMMTAFDKECPRCHGKGIPGKGSEAQPVVAPKASVVAAPPVPAQPAPLSPQGAPSHGKEAFEAFTPLSLGMRLSQVTAGILGVLAFLGGITTLRENFILGLLLAGVGLLPPLAVVAAIRGQRVQQIANSLQAVTGMESFACNNGRGVSVDSRQRSVVISTAQKDGFWIRRLPAEAVKVELHHHQSTQLSGRSFSGTGCLLSGCLLGPLGGILGGMALGSQKLEETNSYRVRIFIKDPLYPEHTLDFGQDRNRAERIEAMLKSIL